jgi:hypothetical protein
MQKLLCSSDIVLGVKIECHLPWAFALQSRALGVNIFHRDLNFSCQLNRYT